MAHAHNTAAEHSIWRHQLWPIQRTLSALDFPQYSVANYFSHHTYEDFSRRDTNTPYSLYVRATPKKTLHVPATESTAVPDGVT